MSSSAPHAQRRNGVISAKIFFGDKIRIFLSFVLLAVIAICNAGIVGLARLLFALSSIAPILLFALLLPFVLFFALAGPTVRLARHRLGSFFFAGLPKLKHAPKEF